MNDSENAKSRIISEATRIAIQKLKLILADMPAISIAFSGGMDSSLLAIITQQHFPQKSQIIIVDSAFMSRHEMNFARATASKFEFKLKELMVNVLDESNIIGNSKDRCYFCKKLIFLSILENSKNYCVCEGSIIDDDNDYRPGKKALNELKVRSPLYEARFTKKMVAEALACCHASHLIRPAQSCLATRIATDTPITAEKLFQIESGEKILQEAGLSSVRLRHHGDIARIEANHLEMHRAVDIPSSLVDSLKKIGFRHICLDIEGYKKGSMNRL